MVVMKAPIWYLVSKVGSASGGDAWHRARLMDMAFQNLGSWWLAGMPIRDTADWFPYVLVATGGADIANNYLVFGITAGLGSLILLLVVLKRAFSMVGNALTVLRSDEATRGQEIVYWSLGIVLFVHVEAWFGTSYFDQFNVLWLFQLAAIATLTEEVVCAGAQPVTRVADTRIARRGEVSWRSWRPSRQW